jgi:hypothetical protein
MNFNTEGYDDLYELKVRRINDLIQKYEEKLKEYKDGHLMSTNESLHGQIWCEDILKDLKEL